jgi:hypothetical protein
MTTTPDFRAQMLPASSDAHQLVVNEAAKMAGHDLAVICRKFRETRLNQRAGSLPVSVFPGGGFVVHKACGGATSGWFDASGNLTDAEFRDSLGRSRPVRPGSSRWAQLQALGRRLLG